MRRIRVMHLLAALVIIIQGGFFVTAAGAAWSEGDAEIRSLAEMRSAIEAAFGGALVTDLPGDTPLILAGVADPSSEKGLRIALARAELALSVEEGVLRLARVEGPTPRDRSLAERRAIFPARPAPGSDLIRSGQLVLQGEILPAPLRVEVLSGAILVNGEQVYPLPASPAPPLPVPEDLPETIRLRIAAVNRYELDAPNRGEAVARADLLRAMTTLPDVADARWGAEGVTLRMADGSEELVAMQPRERRPEPDDPALGEQILHDKAEWLRLALIEGGSLFAGTNYLFTLVRPNAGRLRTRVEAIRASGEPELLKLTRLQALVDHRRAAADLLYSRQGGTR